MIVSGISEATRVAEIQEWSSNGGHLILIRVSGQLNDGFKLIMF